MYRYTRPVSYHVITAIWLLMVKCIQIPRRNKNDLKHYLIMPAMLILSVLSLSISIATQATEQSARLPTQAHPHPPIGFFAAHQKIPITANSTWELQSDNQTKLGSW